MIATIAQNSVVLNACFVSVVRRAITPDLCAGAARLPRTASVAMPDPFSINVATGMVADQRGLPPPRRAKHASSGPGVKTRKQEMITQVWRRTRALSTTTGMLWPLVAVIVVAWLVLLLVGAATA
jgi:hypothetical protein